MSNVFDQFDLKPSVTQDVTPPPAAAPPAPSVAPPPAEPPPVTSSAPNPFDQFDIPDVTKAPTAEPGASLWGSIGRGAAEVTSGLDVMKYAFGASNPEEFANALVANEAQVKANPKTQAELNAEEGGLSIGGLFQNPSAILGLLGESVPGMGLTAATTVAGGFAGPAGAIAGLAAGGGFSVFGSGFKNYLRQQGVDLANPMSVRLALADPDLVNEAFWYAAKQAGVAGAVNAIVGKLGEGVVTRFFNPGATLASKATGVAATIGLGAGAGAATNVGSRVATGEPLDPTSVAVDTFLGGLLSAPFAIPGGVELITSRRRNTAPTEETIARVAREASQQPEAQRVAPAPVGEGAAVASLGDANATYYSALDRYVREKGPERASAEQWANTLRNAPGVKEEEVRFTKLDKMLEGWKDNEPVTKQQVLQWVDENRVRMRIEEVTQDQSHYRSYNRHLPGGALGGYKEFLFRLLDRELPYDAPHFGRDQANVDLLAHARTTDHFDTEGRKVLVVNEIQSDLHQQARKEGYNNTPQLPPGFRVQPFRASDGQRFYVAGPDDIRDPDYNQPFVGPTAKTREEAIARGYARWREDEGHSWADYNPDAWPAPILETPFKTTWPSLVAKKLIRHAVENGYDSIAWPQGFDAQMIEGGDLTNSGLKKFYDTHVKQTFSKLGRQLGAKESRVILDLPASWAGNDVWPALILDEGVKARAREGFALYSHGWADKDIASARPGQVKMRGEVGGLWEKWLPAAELSTRIMHELSRQFGISKPIFVAVMEKIPNSDTTKGNVTPQPNGYYINIAAANHNTPESVHATLMHEFGHVVAFDKWHTASKEVQIAVHQGFQKFLDSVSLDEKFVKFLRKRDNAVSLYHREVGSRVPGLELGDVPNLRYWTGFSEWFAEQVARWATTSERPLSVVDKFFSALGKKVRRIVDVFSRRTKQTYEPNATLNEWLDSFVEQIGPRTADDWLAMEERTKANNQRDLNAVGGEEVDAAPQTAETTGGRGAGNTLFGGEPPPGFRASASAADRFNRFYKYMLSMPQVAARNRRIRSLQLYNETTGQMHLERVRMMDRAMTTLKVAEKLGSEMKGKLGAFIDDYRHMQYLSEAERTSRVKRLPTEAELRAMMQKHGVSEQALRVFEQMRNDFHYLLDQYGIALRKQADRITDVALQAQKLLEIDRQIADLKSKPFFPTLQFGKYKLTIRDSQGKVVHYETFDTRREQRSAERMAKKGFYPDPLFETSIGVVAEDVGPMVGMPPGLFDLIGEKLDLSTTQREALDELRFDLHPAQSFRRKFAQQRPAGYSQDFYRTFANFFFHGSNHIARVKYVDQLRSFIKDLRQQADVMPDGSARGQIANFLSDHLHEMMNPRPDFLALRGMIFHWALGFNPAAAALNLSQLFVGSAPFLADKFGDVRMFAAMSKAGAKLSTYYREATLKGTSDPELRALSRGIQEGVVTEAMSPMLAGISEGRNLGRKFGSTSEQMWREFGRASAGMFQMTEQMNRRVTFRAAWDLAFNDPGNAYVAQAIKTNELEYASLRNEGWGHRDAAAYLAAKDAVQSTQYVYASYARPRFMRGRAGTVFVFKSFVQNTLFMLWNHPGTAARSMLVMGFLGGMMGIPGTEDLADMLKVLGWQLFGKDFDLEREARKFVTEMTDGTVPPDILLHGLARKGYGIPALMDMLGVHSVPEIDQSRSMGLGAISPIPLAPLLGPVTDTNQAIAETAQRASGAAFSVGFNMYKALANTQLSPFDIKRWEGAMPRALRNASRAYRAFSEGQERTAGGATVINYDVHDPEHMMEMIGLGLGYYPTRLTAEWDRTGAIREVTQFWNIRRAGLLRQLDWAQRSGDKVEFDRAINAIKNFNQQLPKEAAAKAITRDQIRQSLKSRERARSLLEAGSAVSKSDRPIVDSVNKLYPEAEIDRRVVK